MIIISLISVLFLLGHVRQSHSQSTNSTFFNPVLPGLHSDPSCTRVDEIFYCVTSSFISFPGLPVWASKDLINWRLVSYVWDRDSQLPGISWNTRGQQHGMYAPTIRYHAGEFFVICQYFGISGGVIGVIFRTADPLGPWSDPVRFKPSRIDPDLFWDTDGKVYTAMHGIVLQEINLETGSLTSPVTIWNGTGGIWPEGPHIYKRDGWYYLLIAEGGTGLNHSMNIARSEDIWGPYESFEENPILTNRGTGAYFQTVGHGDLFTDVSGNWWGICHATRSGPEYIHYPMGREAVLFPVKWEQGEWPTVDPVKGAMEGWALPPRSRDVPGTGHFNSDPDHIVFHSNSSIPKHFVHWRVPRNDSFTVTDDGLQIVPTRNNLTGVPYATGEDIVFSGQRGSSLIARHQTHPLFSFSVDLDFAPTQIEQEAGISVFLTQVNHIDVSLCLFAPSDLRLRLRAEGSNSQPLESNISLPTGWSTSLPITLHIIAETPDSYRFAASQGRSGLLTIGEASSALVSGGNGSYTCGAIY
ncbi:unnamed protein product [Clonostachys rosea]|uniref:Beta-xylosidase C-terminal Concanavalin A-like domain-containing protein n=1 Tax=Bionectria ochroleuca TaxID=29856 RepID=A0ABY6UX84_BIOOC|nr:unnamed protein product [Clonostachys rosea]